MNSETISQTIKNVWLYLAKAILLVAYGIQMIFGVIESIDVTKETTGGFMLMLGGITVLFAISNARIVRFWFWIIEGAIHIVFGIILALAGSRLTGTDYTLIITIWIYVLTTVIYLTRREKQRFMVKKPARILFTILGVLTGTLILFNKNLPFTSIENLFGGFIVILSIFYAYHFIWFGQFNSFVNRKYNLT